MKVLFLVTARGGSKGVPRKNIRKLNGLELIGYKIISAKKTRVEKRIILSTDDEEIAKIGKQYGAEVPFMRPKELASDTASSVDAVIHAMDWVEKNDETKYDIVFLLEPSSPFGTFIDFEKALKLLNEHYVDNVVGVRKTEPNSIFIVPLAEDGSLKILGERIKKLNFVYRQHFKDEYTPNGTLYCSKWNKFKENKTFYTEKTFPIIQDEHYSIEIDCVRNLEFAEYIVDKKLIDLDFWKE